jgi:hypothetical protein
MDGVKQQDSTPQNDSTLGFKWIKKITQNTNYIVMSKRLPPFFSKIILTFVIQMLVNVFPRIVFVRTFFLHISRESNNIYCFCLIIFALLMKPRTYIEYVLDEPYKFNLQSSIFNKICNFLIDQCKYN